MNCWKGMCKFYRFIDGKKICSLDNLECDFKYHGFDCQHCRHENDPTSYDFDLHSNLPWFSCKWLCRFYDSCEEM